MLYPRIHVALCTQYALISPRNKASASERAPPSPLPPSSSEFPRPPNLWQHFRHDFLNIFLSSFPSSVSGWNNVGRGQPMCARAWVTSTTTRHTQTRTNLLKQTEMTTGQSANMRPWVIRMRGRGGEGGEDETGIFLGVCVWDQTNLRFLQRCYTLRPTHRVLSPEGIFNLVQKRAAWASLPSYSVTKDWSWVAKGAKSSGLL